ncbi:type III pantothenate kinase [Halomonas sp. KAO]|uniref:type III pantothenate kinase n=1 Tax=unclassified Halomonas TaxID=2609666 RepID=UPI0018A11E32|nr:MULTISPECIES: type III pantothenate kinase [unclassified Halomonas]MBF7054209.1 type III pantothenate kinase [Halomonas sp. KAO]MDT0502255.1 type III pantothenate kinase [Halomonas sp. PAR7]MDT0513329.1 type III pantothenate kinase [Halomonas sp. LES1]MDT0591905.1 type III pantothenate kinase [Halomonas sp. PAR8]
MILDLDIGNTLSKWRLKDVDTSEIRSRGAVWTREEWRPGADIPNLEVVESVRISSVARRAVLEETVQLLRQRVGAVYVASSTPEALGVTNGYEEPERLGVDRWLGVLAGYQQVGACCAVDCGSAITIDFVLPGGRHLGGYILPGLRLMKESLKLGTRNVAIDPDSEPEELLVPGKRTVEAVNHGIYMAAVSAINRVYAEVCDSEGVALPLMLTGGDARVVARGLQVPHAVWPDMVYGGLEACFPLTAAERAGRMAGAPCVPSPVALEKIRAGLAFSMLL